MGEFGNLTVWLVIAALAVQGLRLLLREIRCWKFYGDMSHTPQAPKETWWYYRRAQDDPHGRIRLRTWLWRAFALTMSGVKRQPPGGQDDTARQVRELVKSVDRLTNAISEKERSPAVEDSQ